jgi:hypothetical protein
MLFESIILGLEATLVPHLAGAPGTWADGLERVRGTPGGARIAMWSGPRNISTAMLRAWGNRPDTFVCDEPLYAHYLRETGIDHPGREEVIASQENDWRKAAEWLAGEIPEGKTIFYQKHMAQHLLPNMYGDWLLCLQNAFLIRDPGDMLISLSKVMPTPRLEDTGLPQQWRLFEMLRERTGRAAPVIDAREVLDDPERMLTRLCRELGVSFDRRMLSWEPGPRSTDGVWAEHWYSGVLRSTGFRPYPQGGERLPPEMSSLHEKCMECYERLHSERLTG